MRAKSIAIQKLFGRFDYTIPLNLDERITIIHGPNGYGKTALLKLVDAMFNQKLDVLRSTPFAALRVDLEDGSYVAVRRIEQENTQTRMARLPAARRGEGGGLRSEHEPVMPVIALDYTVGNGKEVLASCQLDASNEEEEDEEDPALKMLVQNIRGKLRPDGAEHDEPPKAIPATVSDPEQWSRIEQALSALPVHSITIQRLLVLDKQRHLWSSTFKAAVSVYSQEFRKSVQRVQARYTQEAQHLDRTFPQRMMHQNGGDLGSDDDLKQALTALEERRTHLIALGLLPSDDTEFQVPGDTFDDATRRLLWVYARDIEEKLSVFDALAAKVDLLQTIINKRFQFKRLKIDMEQGFTFVSEDDGRELPSTALSSGEQHELIMLYECLFKLKPDSLLLIDEPELSLHVSWQIEFLRDLQEIIGLAHFDVLLATHSPQVIHDRWDLTVDLHDLLATRTSRPAGDVLGESTASGPAE